MLMANVGSRAVIVPAHQQQQAVSQWVVLNSQHAQWPVLVHNIWRLFYHSLHSAPAWLFSSSQVI